jgi:hypothetical protein
MIVVYTVITGSYETLRPAKYPGICLTDGSPKLVKGWEVREIKKEHPDPRRASRHPKMMPHKYFPDVEYTIYVDGNVVLLRSPEKIVKDLLQREDVALFQHPERMCVYKEAKKCVEYKKADPEVVKSQIEYYRAEGFPADQGLTACWVIVRRNTPEVQKFGEIWWKEYLRFSCRDQLSFDFVRWQTKLEYDRIPGNLFKGTSKYFQRGKHIRRPGK